MTILVTGGAGYIGSHTCKLLSRNGYTPVCYDNLSTGHRDAVKWGPLEKADINNPEELDRVIKKYRPKAVIHFAAHSLVAESMLHPARYYRNNVDGTLTLLEVMRDNDIEHMVFSSSCAVYGIPDKTPIPESHPRNPISTYGKTKLIAEYMLEDFSRACEMQYVSLRYFNAAGADPENEIGENHDPETHLIPLVLDVAMGRSAAISVYGNDYDTPDGTCIRDYIHVNDLADAHIKALQYLQRGGDSLCLNIGTGAGLSVKEIVNSARTITGKRIEETLAGRREGDPASLIASSSLSESRLSWTASQSDIGNIIMTAWQWHKKARSCT